jgi:perosamine synthetase
VILNKKVFYPIAEPDLTSLEREALLDAFDSGWISSIGSYINLFEDNFAKFCKTKYAVAVSNGTSALHLALISLGIDEGDEVIIPSLTFVATAAAVVHCGATPVFVDSEELYGTICTSSVEKAITKKTKAIIVVHLYGHPAEMDIINSIAEKNSLFVIEDAAEAHGAKYKSRLVGGIGNIGTFSFYGNKIITTGEGGMITTNDEKISSRIKYLRDHAMDQNKRYWHTEIGYNYRMTNLQAAIGVAQLSRIDEIINKKINLLKYYKEKVNSSLEFHPQKKFAESVPWLICVVISESSNLNRGLFLDKLRENGIDTRPFFIPIHLMPPYSKYRLVHIQDNSKDLICNNLSQMGFNLPSSTKLKFSDLDYIADVINKNS